MTATIIQYENRVEYRNGIERLHRSDGPAVEYNDGSNVWFFNGRLHRLDGPAIECYNGTKEYWIDGKVYSFEEWNRLRKLQAFT
jgi:hypothetical protein